MMPSFEYVKVWQKPGLWRSELLRATYITHVFPRHTHEQYAIGVIEAGALGFYYRGENVVAPRGSINLCIPGEVHTGYAAADGGWTYRMFYFDAQLLQRVASEMVGRPRDVPFFRSGVIHDEQLAQLIQRLHMKLATASTPAIEQESCLLWTLAQMIGRYADDPPTCSATQIDVERVKKIQGYIEDHYAQDISLDDLAQVVYLSPFHLVRMFRSVVGVPPHAYLRQVRVWRAKELLTQGKTIATAAAETGFVDQSHLSRWFKRFCGYTPGQYRKSIQDL